MERKFASGDTVSFPIGDRIDEDGNALLFNAMLQYEEGGEITEHFQEREERQFQVVGFFGTLGRYTKKRRGYRCLHRKRRSSLCCQSTLYGVKTAKGGIYFYRKTSQ